MTAGLLQDRSVYRRTDLPVPFGWSETWLVLSCPLAVARSQTLLCGAQAAKPTQQGWWAGPAERTQVLEFTRPFPSMTIGQSVMQMAVPGCWVMENTGFLLDGRVSRSRVGVSTRWKDGEGKNGSS